MTESDLMIQEILYTQGKKIEKRIILNEKRNKENKP